MAMVTAELMKIASDQLNAFCNSPGDISLTVDKRTAMAILSVLEMGLGHPDIPNGHDNPVRRVCGELIDLIAPAPSPLRTMLLLVDSENNDGPAQGNA